MNSDIEKKIREVRSLVLDTKENVRLITQLVQSMSSNLVLHESPISPTVIMTIIKKEFNLEITTKTRRRPYVHAREVAVYLLKKYTTLTLKEIGEYVGAYDHTSILYYITKVEGYLKVDETYRLKFQVIEEKLKDYNNRLYAYEPSNDIPAL